STSLRATGSEIPPATSVALLAPPRRSASTALLTSAMSAADGWGAGRCAGGPCARGICGTADLSSADLLPLDLPVDLPVDLPATFFPVAFVVFPAALAVACAPLAPRAAAVSAARVIASALAQASAATSADRYRDFKICPQIPGEWLRPKSNSGPRPPEVARAMQQHWGGKVPALSPKRWLCLLGRPGGG